MLLLKVLQDYCSLKVKKIGQNKSLNHKYFILWRSSWDLMVCYFDSLCICWLTFGTHLAILKLLSKTFFSQTLTRLSFGFHTFPLLPSPPIYSVHCFRLKKKKRHIFVGFFEYATYSKYRFSMQLGRTIGASCDSFQRTLSFNCA